MRLRSDMRGQATSEYVALVALVAVVLGLAAGLTTGGVGGQVLAGLQRGLCRVVGAACPRPQPARADLAPCPVERTTSSESLDGALEVVKLGRSGTLTAVRGSDGRVSVTLADGMTAGAEVGLGFKLATGERHDAEAKAGITASIVSGRSWTLPSAAAARAFVDRYGAKATIGGKAVDLVRSGCSILCDAIGWQPHAELPPPDELYMGQGALAKVEAPLGGSTLRASASGLLGARLRRDGSSTWFLQVDAAVGADVELLPATLMPSLEHQAVVSYTRDARHRPVELVVHTVARGALGGTVRGARGAWRAGVGAGRGLVTEVDATLDLHDPQNRAAAAAFVAALRDPLAPGTLRSRAAVVRERIASTGAVDRRVYALSSTAFELGATVALGAQLGGAFEHTTQGMRLLTAETRLPGLPFLPRDDCRVA